MEHSLEPDTQWSYLFARLECPEILSREGSDDQLS
jgi:hypothetical protein